ncbi:histidine phosphatase family protein [Paracraurococcus lichenis]|uniref:Histidine phosphatase family protein n=1 Tax=Paracraurococcus lichenis TaxID=3064888 RepID=A0ABT9E8R4_9PROT|nr:histidine phosphatase family protein [Paracraurococcus sp. LOR1-02]MDO9712335.1 histidine phosphatase family protein [Paracraurococcus sp. LOR1-02]
MAASILLVRHATHPLVGKVLCGRAPGVSLGAAGRDQAARLGAALAGRHPAAICTSPVERARDTADAIAAACRVPASLDDALDEIDFGDWTGQSFDRLAGDPAWARWNAARGEACPPGGESMHQAQARAVAGIQRLRTAHPDGTVVAVSHADVIKAVLMWCLGLPLDRYHAFDIDPASVSTLLLWDGGGKVVRMNEGIAA